MNTTDLLCLSVVALGALVFLLLTLKAFVFGKAREKAAREAGWLAERNRDGYPVVVPFTAAMKASQSGKFSVKGGAGENIDSDKKFEDLAD